MILNDLLAKSVYLFTACGFDVTIFQLIWGQHEIKKSEFTTSININMK